MEPPSGATLTSELSVGEGETLGRAATPDGVVTTDGTDSGTGANPDAGGSSVGVAPLPPPELPDPPDEQPARENPADSSAAAAIRPERVTPPS